MGCERPARAGRMSHMTTMCCVIPAVVKQMKHVQDKYVAAVSRRAQITRTHLSSCLPGRYAVGPKLLDRLPRALPGGGIDVIRYLSMTQVIRDRPSDLIAIQPPCAHPGVHPCADADHRSPQAGPPQQPLNTPATDRTTA